MAALREPRKSRTEGHAAGNPVAGLRSRPSVGSPAANVRHIAPRHVICLAATIALLGAGCGSTTARPRPQSSAEVVSSPDRAPVTLPLSSTSGTDTATGPDVPPTVASSARNILHGVSLWLPYWNMPAALSSALSNSSLVRTASPFWYAISGDSTVDDDPGAGDTSIISALRSHGIGVVPTVTENEDMDEFDRMLASPGRRTSMVRALVSIAASRAYSGLDLDFEDFAVDAGHDPAPADEAAARYPGFVAQVCAALHAIGRSCTVTIMPRTSGNHVYWRDSPATWVYDYGAIAAVADRVRIMAYDEHAPGGPAGPVAPYGWVKQVIAYAASTMSLDKVELALPAYGYDWTGDSATSFTSRQAGPLAAEHGVAPRWDPAQAEQTFSYTTDGVRHTVWYEDARSEYARARLAVAAGFAGIDLWAAGGEDAAVWPMLRRLR